MSLIVHKKQILRPFFAEDTTYLGFRTLRNQAGSGAEISFLLPSFHSVGRGCESCWGRSHQWYYPDVDPTNYKNDPPYRVHPPVKKWHDHYEGNQLFSYWIRGLIHRRELIPCVVCLFKILWPGLSWALGKNILLLLC